MTHLQHFLRRDCHAVFTGRDRAWQGEPQDVLCRVTERLGLKTPSLLANLRQVHSATAVRAEPGMAPEADALTTNERNLALVVVTADCVPILLESGGAIGAVHAGWKGLAGGVIENALTSLRALHRSPCLESQATAWVGPCMAACCYEVGYEVALAVAQRSGTASVATRHPGHKPSVGLEHAAAAQLSRFGVEDIRPSTTCTGCSHDSWWSYRRLGPSAGRNLAFIWREGS